MRIDDFSLAFNCSGCPSWGTAIINQDTKKLHLIKKMWLLTLLSV